MESKYMLLAIPVFIFFMLLEYFIGKQQQKEFYQFADTITNLNIGMGNQLLYLFTKFIFFEFYIFIYENWSFFSIETNLWTSLICLLAFDFVFYWTHRWGHEVNFLWGSHIVHHSSEEYNLSVALRQPWFSSLMTFFIYLPFPLLGFDPLLFFTILAVDTLYQFWIHTKAINKLPYLIELIFNTPSHHRVHHAIEPKYIDKNYAGIFIIWDRLLGTFKQEEESPTYGITNPLNSFNPIWANWEYFSFLFQESKRFTKWKDKIRIFFFPPGWQPKSFGGQQYPKEVNYLEYKKYSVDNSTSTNAYVFLQFVLIVVAMVELMLHFSIISDFYKFIFALTILLSLLICGGILEKKNWVQLVEYLRLTIILLSINSFYYYWYPDWFLTVISVTLPGFIIFSYWFYLTVNKSSTYKL